MFGYCGKLLRVDLTKGKATTDSLDEKWARKYLGGRGLGARILFDEVPAGADPLGPENKLIFAMGPLAGTSAPASGRFAIVSKSPMTGGFGEAFTGGFFAHELKYAGYDAIIVEGRASEPVYIHINNDDVEVRPASHIWGKETLDMEETLKDELGDIEYRFASIGPGGERRIRFSNIMNDTDRAAGRTGLGAVMGSKNLKAIAVRGTKAVKVADPERFRDNALANVNKINSWPTLTEAFRVLGTAGGVEGLDADGILPTRYWESGTFQYADRISGTAMKNTILIGHRACQACPVGCTRVVRVTDGKYAGVRPEYGGPEYETVAAFGSLCENRNLEAIARVNQMCNAWGLDTISCGSVVAFAFDLFNRGLITEKDVGFRLEWGDPDAIVKLVDMIGRREGFGDLLAEGARRVGEKIGGDAAKLPVHVKGLDLGMHEARGKKGLGLSYATAPRGADHMEGYHDPAFMAPDSAPEIGVTKGGDRFQLEGKSDEVIRVENYNSFINSVPLCSFMSLPITGVHNTEEITGALAAATGWDDLTIEEEMTIGERAYSLAKAYTAREKNGDPEDRLPFKLTRPLDKGATEGQAVTEKDLKAELASYYKIRGWTEAGIPTKAKLEELGLEDVAATLYGGSK